MDNFWYTPATTAPCDTQHTFLPPEDTSLEHKLNRFWEVDSEKQSTMTAQQQAGEKHFLSHTTQQRDGTLVVRLPTLMRHNELGNSRLSAE
jgi:hypothetical protein